VGFFYAQSAADARAAKTKTRREIPIALMKDLGCKACPADEVDERRITPKLPPRGSDTPLVYVLGASPTMAEDEEGKHLQGDAFDVVRSAIPADMRQDVRYGHTVRCRTLGKQRDAREAVCCSGLLQADIEATKPKVVLGLGALPLSWALRTGNGATSINNMADFIWRGRMWPIKVGEHVCWYYCLQDPLWVAIAQSQRKHDTEHTATLRRDVKDLFKKIDDFPDASKFYVPEEQRATRIEVIDGSNELHYEALCMFLDEAQTDPMAGVDIETSKLRPYSEGAIIATCAISIKSRTLAFPVLHPEGWNGDKKMQRMVVDLLLHYLRNSNAKTAHNLIFELEWFAYTYDQCIMRETEWHDSMAAAHTLDKRPGALSLGATTVLRFGFDVKSMSNLDTARILEYPLLDVLHYNALDAKWGREAQLDMMAEFEDVPKLWEEYQRKTRTTPSLVMSQLIGLPVDFEYAALMRDTLQKEYDDALRLLTQSNEVKKFERMFGRSFVPGGDDEVLLLRDVMKRDEGARGEGSYSVDDATLSAIPKSAGISPGLIQTMRGSDKLLGTYIRPVFNQDPKKGTVLVYPDGRMHPSYNLMIAETDRLSCEDPNAQNYPKRKRKEVRGYVVTPDGRVYVFVACDYGQLEARVIAMASEDRNLVDSLWTDFDIHGHWATRFVALYPEIKDWVVEEFEVDWDEKGMKTLRQECKNKWVFPQFFGSSYRSCAASMHLPLDIAEDASQEFWDQFKGVKRWQQRMVDHYAKHHYVETLLGSRRYGPLSLNQIINTPIQGTGAHIVLDAQNRISEMAQSTERWHLVPPLNVHDDLSYFIPRVSMVEDVELIAHTMCDCRFPFVNVPILVEVSVSQHRWHEMSEIGVYRSDQLGMHTR
jgi:uracil-DNA glycosylase family 4